MTPTELLGDRRCPVCNDALEVVHNSANMWRVSCFKNDWRDDEPPPCAFADVYGSTQEAAIANFDEHLKDKP